GPGRVGPPEAAEDAGGLAGLEPDAVVPDGHRDRAPGGRQAHDDVLALAVFHGVDHEDAQDALDAPGVGLGDDGLLVAQDPDAVALAFGERFGPADHAPDDLAQVYRLRLQCRRARVEAADLQEVREQRLEAVQLVGEQFGGPRGHRVEVLAGLVDDVGGHPHRGE